MERTHAGEVRAPRGHSSGKAHDTIDMFSSVRARVVQGLSMRLAQGRFLFVTLPPRMPQVGLNDAAEEARAHSRRSFLAFEARFPKRAEMYVCMCRRLPDLNCRVPAFCTDPVMS